MYLNSYTFTQGVVAKFPKLHGFREIAHRVVTSPLFGGDDDRAYVARRVAVTSSPPTNRPTDRTCSQCRSTSPCVKRLRPSVRRMTGDLISRWLIARVERRRCRARPRTSSN